MVIVSTMTKMPMMMLMSFILVQGRCICIHMQCIISSQTSIVLVIGFFDLSFRRSCHRPFHLSPCLSLHTFSPHFLSIFLSIHLSSFLIFLSIFHILILSHLSLSLSFPLS